MKKIGTITLTVLLKLIQLRILLVSFTFSTVGSNHVAFHICRGGELRSEQGAAHVLFGSQPVSFFLSHHFSCLPLGMCGLVTLGPFYFLPFVLRYRGAREIIREQVTFFRILFFFAVLFFIHYSYLTFYFTFLFLFFLFSYFVWERECKVLLS